MPQNESINNTEDYINYTFHISSKGVGTVAGELVGLSNTVSNLLGDIAFKTSEMLSNTETLAIGTSIAVGAMFTSAIKDSIRFEQQMANVKAIGGESLNAQEIGNAAMEYSNKFGMATASMTEGLEALARAGITTTSVMKSVLEEGVKLSKLEGMDLEDSINDLIATTNLLSSDNVNMNDAQYADMVKQMNQHIVSTSESAPINAQNIIQSLQHVGGYASAGGMDQDDLFAVIAQLGSRGTKGEMAGTALRAFIAAGQKDTAQRALARIGLNVSDLWNDNGETMLSISEMKDVLDNALEARGYSKQEKLEFYSDFAGYKQANQIMKIDTSEVQQYKEQIANAWDLGKKLDTILGTVRGNLDRIWQITQNFMTKVGGKILFIANAILTPVRMLLELINKMPFADTAVAAGMIIIGFNGVLKIINNIVPRFSTFFIQLSQSKRDALDIRNVWRKLPDDIAKAKDVLKAMSDPKKMIQIQQKRQLYSKKEIEAVENKVARVQFIHANLGDESLQGLNANQRKAYLSDVWSKKDNIYKENFINSIKAQDPEKFTNMMQKYLKRAVDDSNLSASRVSYDIEGIATSEALWDIDNYVGWIYRILSDPTFRESKPQEASIPSGERQGTQDNRQRNARVNERKTAFRDMGNNILRQGSEYGDYSYKVNPNINMPQFNYNDIEDMRRFEAQVKSEIQRKMDMYANFFEDSSIEAGRNRLKKSLTIAAKTDLGYEFSTGANTSDIKKILETGNIREGSSHILDEQLQTIADILETELTGNRHDDMRRFSNILNSKNNKDELLASILNKTQEQWNSKYYNNGRVGYFPTNALKEASGGVTAQKIMEKVGVSSIAEVQEHFKNVALDDTLLNECVDIMYQDKELVEKLVNEEIKYMYENLARVQNSILSASRESHNDSTFQNKGEEYVTNLQKARDYVLADFNPNEFERFTSSPNGNIGKFTISQAIDAQNQHLLQDTGYEENIEGFQGYIYPIGGDIARSQRYGNDNFKIRNIKHIPYNKLLGQNVEEVFLDRHGDIGFDFMETFADWVSEVAAFDKGYWETTFDADYADDYWISGFEGGQEKFNELKQELEEIYRAYVDLCAWGAQSLIEATTLYGPMVSYRGGRLYTPENSFGAFDTITSTSLHYGVAKNFWNENPQQRKILEIFSPEDTHGVLAHTDLLNGENEHLWGRERELTLGKDQPYLHLPNPEGFEERLLMLTDDQKNAVKEIMGEGFEFEKNAPFDPFLNAGESSSTSNILRNKLSLMLNKDNLTADNIGIKLQDLLTNGAISVGTKYRSGSLGGSNSDDVIDINTGTIKYHADNYNELYGDYGNALLDTVLHEMTHVLMMHKERQNYENNNIPSELGIDNFKTSQLIQGYDRNFVAEYEAQYVSSQVLNRLGIEANQKSQQRMAAFKDLIESKGYGDQIQYELLDNLVDEMLSNITVIGDITEELSTQFDMASAGVTSMQVSEDMRPILSKIQAFNKNIKVYEGPDAKSKKDEIDQILSDMGGEINLLSSYGFDDSMIYNMIAQKFLPYIQQHSEYGFDTFYEYASSNRNIDKAGKYDNVTDAILSSWEYFKHGEGSSQINGRLSTSTFYDYISKTYGEDIAADAQKWIEDASKNVDGLITYANTENPGISLNKNKIPNMVKEWNNTRKQLAYFESISLPNAGISMLLPVHKEFAEHGYTLNENGNIAHDVAQKYIHKNSANDARKFLGIVDLLDTDFFRNLDKADQDILKQAITHGENAQYTIPQLMDSDGKLGKGWGAINVTTAMDCMGRLEDGSCQFCDACYAFGQAARLPEQAIKQIAKSLLFANTSAEDFAKIINQQSIQIVRFNQEGDFKDLDDYLKTAEIAKLSPNSKFYGYTKNEEILEYIKDNGTPDNYQMNNSLGTWDTGNYVVAHWSEIIDYLEKDYKLCQGACEACKQCLVDINKVTILRAGGEPLKVGNLKHLTTEGQIEVFKRLRDKEAQGDKVTKQFAEGTIKEVSRISKFVKPIKGQTTLFSNQGESSHKTKQATLDPLMTQTKAAEFGMPGLVENIDYIKYQDEMRKQQERERVEQIRQQYSHIRGAGVNIPQDHSMPGFSSQAYADFQNQYAEQGDYLLMNKWDKARYKLNQDGKSHKFMNKGIDLVEKFTTNAQTQINNNYKKSIEDMQQTDIFDKSAKKVETMVQPLQDFTNVLDSLSDIFPILTPAVMFLNKGLSIATAAIEILNAIQAYNTTITGANTTAKTLNTMAEEGNTAATYLNTVAKWAETGGDDTLKKAIGTVVNKGIGFLAKGLSTIGEMSVSTVAMIALPIIAIIAAIEAIKFWENKHAEALKESQKALEEATAKNNVALSQYKDLKKARENETDAIKKQKIARREAIALYELEAARIKKRKAVQDEAKLRNDAVWGEYGLRASLQKMGLGFIAGGDFQSQYENYDGTTANIRQVKESTLGNLFASSEQRYVASVYDKNSNFFAEVEAYKEPLQELYDKESKLIEQYGSIDLARSTKEFEDAVQEFADATGINGETAVKMLEWLETENKVNQATKVGQAQIGIIRARADAKVAGLEYGEGGDLNDMNTLGNAMVMAQFQDMMNTAKTEVWWELLYAYLDTFISILLPWKWGDISKNLATVGIRQEELAELDAEGNNILNSMYDAYENADRRDYGSGVSYTSDTPFGGAVSSAATMYAEEEQQKYFAQTGHAMSEEDYMAIQEQYQEDTFGVTHEGLKQKKAKEDKEAYEKAKAEQNKKATTTLTQLQNNGEQAHRDALDIIDAIKNPRSASGIISGAGAGIFSLLESNSPLMSSLRKRGLKDVFKWMSGEEGTLTGKVVSTVKGHFKGAQAAYADDGFSGLYRYGKEGLSKGLSGLKTEATVARDVFRTNGWSGLKGYAEGALYNSKLYTKFSNRVAGAREINAWSEGLGTDIGRTKFDKMVGLYDGAKAAYADDSYKGLAKFGKEVGKSGIKGLAQAGKSASGELGGIRGVASSVSSEVGGIRGLASSTASGMKDIFNPKALAGGVDDIAKGLGGSGTLAKGIGKVGGRALAFLGPALAFADKASELNPFEGKHYNEDGTEKKALQATGEVVGTTAGALGGVAGGLAGAEAGAALGATIGSVIPGVGTVIGGALGAVAGGIAGGWLGDTIFQPIGDAIGGTIGWLGDNLLGGIQNVAGTVWDGLTGAAGGVWDAVSGAATGVWDFLTGGENNDQPVGGLLGLTPIGMGINAASGIFDWLSGGNGENDPYKNIEAATGQKMPHSNSQNTVIIKNININTEDDPEKIKSALMNLIIEMQEQISPRQVSRTVGEPPASQSTSETQDENSTPQAEGTDAQSGTPNGNDSNTNPTT